MCGNNSLLEAAGEEQSEASSSSSVCVTQLGLRLSFKLI